MGPASRPMGPAPYASAKRRPPLRPAIVAVLVVVVLIATGCSSSAGAPKPSVTHATGTGAEVASLLAGIPQRGNALGDPAAPVTLEYFGDLECPFCRQFTLDEIPSLIRSYVRSGKLKIEYRSMETATRDPETFAIQQVAALAAGQQGKMWNFIELFYHEQGTEDSGYVTESYLQGLAGQVPGLNLSAWTAARSDAELANTLTRDARAVKSQGLTSTPSFLIANPRNAPYAATIERLLRS
jgi:protein-disulfide isomerase